MRRRDDRVTAVTWKKRSVHLRRNVSLSLHLFHLFMHRWTAGVVRIRAQEGGKGQLRREVRDALRKAAKKNAKKM